MRLKNISFRIKVTADFITVPVLFAFEEITRNASDNVGTVVRNIKESATGVSDIAKLVKHSSEEIKHVRNQAKGLFELADQQRKMVGQFKLRH
jgi:methyl-accepting chemotaxis protein